MAISSIRSAVVAAAVAAVLGGALTAARAGGVSPPRARELPEPAYLPSPARELLHDKMKRHGAEVNALVRAVTLLQYEQARDLSKKIASEPRFAKPAGPTDDSLNASLPKEFFILQDALLEKAMRLSEAAGARDSAAMGRSFGDLMQQCVACHSVYLGPGK